MRKIVFRIKDIDIWYYGFPLREVRPEDLYIPFQGEDENGNSFYSISVDVKTLGQFTGLYDKNGKKVFEGDIVKRDLAYITITAIVKWDLKYLQYTLTAIDKKYKGEVWYLTSNSEDYEVIGNIYDNPELLKGE